MGVNEHLSAASANLALAIKNLSAWEDQAWVRHRNDDQRELRERITLLTLARRIIDEQS